MAHINGELENWKILPSPSELNQPWTEITISEEVFATVEKEGLGLYRDVHGLVNLNPFQSDLPFMAIPFPDHDVKHSPEREKYNERLRWDFSISFTDFKSALRQKSQLYHFLGKAFSQGNFQRKNLHFLKLQNINTLEIIFSA